MADYPEIGGKLTLDTNDFQKSIKQLKLEISNIRAASKNAITEMENGEKSVAGISKKLEELSDVLKKQDVIVKKYQKDYDDLVASKGKDDEETQKKLNRLLEEKASYSNTVLSINKYKKALEEAQEKEKYGIQSIEKLSDKVGEFSPKLGLLISKFANWKSAIGGIVTALGVASVKAVSDGIKAFTEYESAFTNIRKTVDGTEQDFETLNAEIEQMAKTMPKTAAEIAEVGALGGQLGIAVDDLAEFTETMLMLGDATNLTADQAGEMIAQIANITGMSSSDYEKFGSALVELGNNFATTEAKTLEMTQRISRFSKSIGLSVQEVLGLSTALTSMGIEADAGGTAIQKIFTQIQLAVETGNDDLQGFAETAGMTTEEFQKLWKASSIKGFQSFITGMKNLDKQGQSVVVTLDKLGLNEVRLTSVLQALTGDTNTLSTALEMSGAAWDENIALTEEATRKYATLESQQTITANKWALVSKAIGEKFSPIAKSANTISGQLADTLLGIVDPSSKAETAVSNVKDAMSDYAKEAENAKTKNEEVSESFQKLTTATLIANISDVAKAYKNAGDEIEKAGAKIAIIQSGQKEQDATGLGQSLLAQAAYIKDGIRTIDEALELANNAKELSAYGASGKAIKGFVTTANLYREQLASVNADITAQQATMTANTEKQASLIETYTNAVLEGLVSVDFIKAFNKDFGSAIEERVTILQQAASDANSYMSELADITNDFTDGTEGIEKANIELSTYTRTLTSLKNRLKDASEGSVEYETIKATIELVKAKQDELTDSIAKMGGVTEDVAEDAGTEVEELSAKYKTLSEYVKAYGTELQKIDAEIADLEADKGILETLKKSAKEGSTDWEEYSQKIALVSDEIEKLKKERADLLTVEGDDMTKTMESIISQYGTEADKTQLKINSLNESIKQLEDANKTGWSTDDLKSYEKSLDLLKKEIEELQKPAEATVFSSDSIISQYGSDAEKTALKIKGLNETIATLQKSQLESTNTAEVAEYDKAITALTKYRESLTATGEEAGKSWVEAFADGVQGNSDWAQVVKTQAQALLDSFGTIGQYAGEYLSQAIEIATGFMDQEIEEIDSKLSALSDELEERNTEIENTQSERLSQLEDARERGAISEITYYRETAKANQTAEKQKQQAQEETAKKEKQLKQQQEQLRRKQFEAEKANSIATAAINGAVAAVRCFTDLGPVAGAIAAAVVGGLTAAQIALIASQSYVPALALAKGGITSGPTYAMIGDNPSGQEAVIPLESKTMKLLADKIVDSMNRSGSSVVYNNEGNTDGRSYTINQTITPPGGMTKREAYLQARKALRETRKY